MNCEECGKQLRDTALIVEKRPDGSLRERIVVTGKDLIPVQAKGICGSCLSKGIGLMQQVK